MRIENQRVLTGRITHPEAARIRAFLLHVDAQLDEPITIQIFGSAAVRLFTADHPVEVVPTGDVDVTGDLEVLRNTHGARDVLSQASQGNASRLHFQFTNIESTCVGPDWRQQVVDATTLIGSRTLTVELLHPLDLAFSKMARGRPRDLEDCELMLEAVWGGDVEPLRRYFFESFGFALTHQHRELRWSYEDLFDEEFDPEMLPPSYNG